MKKTITILFAAAVLVMTQGCIPTTPTGGNPTPSILTGKIKSSEISYNINGITLSSNYSFTYDATGKLLTMKCISPVLTILYTVEYQTNKVIFKDANGNYTIYYLQPGTNLIDSLEEYNSGFAVLKKSIERDNSNNLVRIFNSVPDPNSSYVVDSFVYNNGNIVSYKVKNRVGTSINETRYQYTYDLTKNRKAGIEVDNLETRQLSFVASTNNIDVEYLGLSIGNTHTNAATVLNWTHNDNTVTPAETTGIINYSFTNFTATNVSVNIIGQEEWSGIPQPTKINNTYY